MFNKNIVAAKDTLMHVVASDSTWGDRLVLVPELRVSRSSGKDTAPATVHFTLKDETGSLLYRKDYTMAGNNRLQGDSTAVNGVSLIPHLSAKRVQVSFSVLNELDNALIARLHILRDSILYTVGADGKKHETGRRLVRVDSIPASVFSSFNRFDHGPLYKGWGQFAWNGNAKGEPIRTDELRASDHNDYIKDGEIDEEAVEKNTLDINKQKFFTMAYSPTTGKYVSATDSVYVKVAMMRASRLGEDEIVVDSINYNLNGEGLSAPVQMTESTSKGKTFSLGFSMGVSLGVNKSNTKQESYTTVSAMDLNGDSYPDWVREDNGKIKVQLTRQIGTLGDGQDYDVEPAMSYGESENTGGDAGLSMNPDSYKLSNFPR